MEGFSFGAIEERCLECHAGYSLEAGVCVSEDGSALVKEGSYNGQANALTGYLESYFEIQSYLSKNQDIAQLIPPDGISNFRFERILPTMEYARGSRKVKPRELDFFPFSISPAGMISTNADLDNEETRACYMFRVKAVNEDTSQELIYEITIDTKPVTVPASVSWTHPLDTPYMKYTANLYEQGWLVRIPSSCMGRFSQMEHEFISGNEIFDYDATNPYNRSETQQWQFTRYRVGSPFYLPTYRKVFGRNRLSVVGGQAEVLFNSIRETMSDYSTLVFPYHVAVRNRWYVFRDDADAIADAPLNWNEFAGKSARVYQKTQTDNFSLRVTNADNEGHAPQEIAFTIKPNPKVTELANSCSTKTTRKEVWQCRYNSEILPPRQISETDTMLQALPDGLHAGKTNYKLVSSLEFNSFEDLKYLGAIDGDNFKTDPTGLLEVKDGKFIIHQARFFRYKNGRECGVARPYHLHSRDLFHFSEGYLELRMQVPPTHYRVVGGSIIMYSIYKPGHVPYEFISALEYPPVPGSPRKTLYGRDLEVFGGWEYDLFEEWDSNIGHAFVRHNATEYWANISKSMYNVIGTGGKFWEAYPKSYSDSEYFTIGMEIVPGTEGGTFVYHNGSLLTSSNRSIRLALDMNISAIPIYKGPGFNAWKEAGISTCDTNSTFGHWTFDYMRIFKPGEGY